jgi:hypothetical protein
MIGARHEADPFELGCGRTPSLSRHPTECCIWASARATLRIRLGLYTQMHRFLLRQRNQVETITLLSPRRIYAVSTIKCLHQTYQHRCQHSHSDAAPATFNTTWNIQNYPIVAASELQSLLRTLPEVTAARLTCLRRNPSPRISNGYRHAISRPRESIVYFVRTTSDAPHAHARLTLLLLSPSTSMLTFIVARCSSAA